MRRLAVRGRRLGGAPATLVLEGGRITRVAPGGRADLEAAIVAPGFVELQLNGAFGADVATGGRAALRELRARLPATGVTSFLATLVSSPREVMERVRDDVRAVAAEPGGARLLGLHLEGPLLSPARAGAHPRDVVADPAADLVDGARLVTLAPERAAGRIAGLAAAGVVVSLGHTGATYDEVTRAADAGATMVTHLYNAMSPFLHREPGAVGAALTDDRLTVGLIADGVHAHPAAARLAVRAKGWRRVALVTDAIAAAGMPAGETTLAGLRVVSDGVAARLPDGTLAGSVLTMDRAVRNLVGWGVPPKDALRMAGEVPAGLLGRRARLEVGAPADLVLLDEELRVRAAIVGGEVVFSASG